MLLAAPHQRLGRGLCVLVLASLVCKGLGFRAGPPGRRPSGLEAATRKLRDVAASAVVALPLLVGPFSAPVLAAPGLEEQLVKNRDTLEELSTIVDKFFLFRPKVKAFDDAKEATKSQLTGDVSVDYARINVLLRNLGDGYTRLVNKEEFMRLIRFDALGVGLLLGPDEVSKEFTVMGPPVPGSSAAQAGIHDGDLILSVDGLRLKGKTPFDLIELVSSNDAPELKVDVQRGDDRFSAVLARKFETIKNPLETAVDRDRRIGYLRLKEFNALARPKLKEALLDFHKQGVEHLVLDLRGNGGGAFQEAVGIAELLLEPGRSVVTVVDGEGHAANFRTAEDANSGAVVKATKGMDLVLWTNSRTASASEVLVGALRDNCRGAVQGTKSFGKGIIQGVYGLKDGGALVLTIARYQTPSGVSIQGRGIEPDLKTPIPRRPVPFAPVPLGKVDFSGVSQALTTCQVPTN
eukprot:scaffold898_cov229-Pinguiococcus_pyrenoidosus.AAC.10